MYAPYARLKRKNSGRTHNHRRPDFYSSLLRVPELPQTIRCPRFFYRSCRPYGSFIIDSIKYLLCVREMLE